LDYDVCIKLFKASGFLYAEPLVMGTLQDVLNFSLGFESTLPGRLGLPLLPNNVAEGVVIKPVHTTMLESKLGMKRVIFKRKVDGFTERQLRPRDFKKDEKQSYPGGVPDQLDRQLLKYEMLALVTEQRIVNTISKLGQPSSDGSTGPSWEEISSALVNDVVAELRADEELWGKFTSISKQSKRGLMMEVKEDCNLTVEGYKCSVQDQRTSPSPENTSCD
jgi:hypothetical protein